MELAVTYTKECNKADHLLLLCNSNLSCELPAFLDPVTKTHVQMMSN